MTAWSRSSQTEAEPLPQPTLFARQDVSVVHKVHGNPALPDNAKYIWEKWTGEFALSTFKPAVLKEI